MDDHEKRRLDDRRQDHETAAQVQEALNLGRAFGSDAAQRYLALRGIVGEVAQLALIESYDRRQAARRKAEAAAAT
jgi:hypothetical protein